MFLPHRLMKMPSHSSLDRRASRPVDGTVCLQVPGHTGDSRSDPSANRCPQHECTLDIESTTFFVKKKK